jgi:hypothetical protein
MARGVEIKELSQVLNYTEAEIMELVEKRVIPNIRFADGKILFPLEEVLAIYKPKPKVEEVPVIPGPTIKKSKSKK